METNFNFPAPPFNHFSGICKNLADTSLAATRVLSRGRVREDPGNEVGFMDFRYRDVESRQSNNLYLHNYYLENIAKPFELDWWIHARLKKLSLRKTVS